MVACEGALLAATLAGSLVTFLTGAVFFLTGFFLAASAVSASRRCLRLRSSSLRLSCACFCRKVWIASHVLSNHLATMAWRRIPPPAAWPIPPSRLKTRKYWPRYWGK